MTDARRHADVPSTGSPVEYLVQATVHYWHERGSFHAEEERRDAGTHRRRCAASTRRPLPATQGARRFGVHDATRFGGHGATPTAR